MPPIFIDGARYVRVTRVDKNHTSFKDCIKGEEAKTCKQIGPKKFYSISELTSQRTTEFAQMWMAGVADVGIGTAAFFTGAWIGLSLESAGVELAADGVMAAAQTGNVVTLVAAYNIDAINPHEQYKQADSINDEVITDKVVGVSDIDLYIDRLNLVLSKLK